ncbi:hypothetical protein COW36_06860 [bacterium (Candidatus Blackallbacteria) CG17_big_fil_post_rev_8_21_14_2_50_48_46]|uniref:Uncharacterized protein n=1 Tax=bacterium (Candidatus Blackallbacteria) CG17_big_fil_post_rev_8_21_14_2_50_48_46 TaxID=2014261 RepID=A0A2M7G791_9BACT|nr:MAG: hypothetical protein COW64_05420 [bacterium (Candidatus Blackallbacteria) CG18_big_fil_WC_8_21_14_2_50_49_26]PIW17916.1 MAG: hypothetical protein COW36_06860 [bacterium (Candidatus Blackallbacteria) CG17_big_fil_post_rev_8_21_14_2_50_48_46]PIW45735.1 MAG: hypothetical protein COW20_19040 [bacterium (Candidatus Blackallbacteria) CG13_big_fil_rev_8_21_14_2_50_49_14]
MQLNSLVRQLETQGKTRNDPREKQAELFLKKGMELLHQAHLEKFKQTATLSQAVDALSASIKFKRTQPEPYLALAYILFIIEDFESAIEYLRETLRISPDHPDALGLLEIITQKSALSKSSSQPPSSRPPHFVAASESEAELDYDALYDQLEAFIVQQVSRVSLFPALRPRADSKGQKEILKFYQEIKEILLSAQKQMQILEEELEVQDLQTRLQPLEVLEKRFALLLQISEQIKVILQRIESEFEIAQQQVLSLGEIENRDDFQIMEENLESLLDTTDQLADEIEGLDQKGYPAPEVEGVYAKLVSEIEKLQDGIDELASRWST